MNPKWILIVILAVYKTTQQCMSDVNVKVIIFQKIFVLNVSSLSLMLCFWDISTETEKRFQKHICRDLKMYLQGS